MQVRRYNNGTSIGTGINGGGRSGTQLGKRSLWITVIGCLLRSIQRTPIHSGTDCGEKVIRADNPRIGDAAMVVHARIAGGLPAHHPQRVAWLSSSPVMMRFR